LFAKPAFVAPHIEDLQGLSARDAHDRGRDDQRRPADVPQVL